MYIKCPFHHVLLEVTDELIKEIKTRHTIGIKQFYVSAQPSWKAYPYVATYIDGPIFHVIYERNNKWKIVIHK